MTIFLNALFTASVAMSAVTALLILLNKLFENKVPAAFRYYAWVIVLAGLLIPFRPSVPIPFEPLRISISAPSEAPGMAIVENAQNEARQISQREFHTAAPAGEKISVAVILSGIWIAGALAVLVFHLRSYGKFVSSVRRWGAEPGDSRIYSIMRNVRDDMGLQSKNVQVQTCALVSSPMLIGFVRPTVILPEKAISPDELDYIFRHELTHYRRGDLWVNLLILLASAIHWFNPFVYLTARAARTECEAACDEAVIAGNNSEMRRQYGETIIGFIAVAAENAGAGNLKVKPVLSTYFYGGSSNMKKRLASIMDTSRKSKWLASFCLVAVIMATILSGSVIAAQNRPGQYIGERMARSIALQHAGVTEQQVVFIKTHMDYENGQVVYDVEFYSGDTEYDYEIDAVDGRILEFDTDIEYYSIPDPDAPSSGPGTDAARYIGEAKAQSIALEHAGITKRQAVFFIKTHMDYDNGRVIYDVEFYSGDTEYDYEIDAISGRVLEHDREIEYYTIPNNRHDGRGRHDREDGRHNSRNPDRRPGRDDRYIGKDEAKSIALSDAGLSERQTRRMRVKLDREWGRMVYEIEFKSGRTEYEYEIDAVTGEILKSDSEFD